MGSFYYLLVVSALMLLTFVFPLAVASGDVDRWHNSALPIAARVSALMAAMTTEEKICQLNHFSPAQLNYTTVPQPFNTAGFGAMTIESTPNPSADGCNMSCRISNLRQFQQDMISNTRLGIPVSFVIETSHSGAAGGTIFPMGCLQGATWNASLVQAVAGTIALEAKAWGGDRGLSPEINVCTDPRFGRTEENFGEDPLLVSVLAAAAVTGLQGGTVVPPTDYLPNFSNALVAEAKHCCAYGSGGFDGAPADISETTLHNVYLRPWKAYIAAGGRGMMMSHNELNSVQMHMNEAIMTSLFRNTYNYTGFFASDANNIDALVNARVAANVTMAAVQAISAGMDQSLLGSAFSPDVLMPAVNASMVSMANLDRAVAAVLQAKFAAGLFDGVLPDPANRPLIYTNTSRALARQVVHEGAVLLENNGILPLQLAKYRRIAVIGPNSGCANAGGVGNCTFTADTDCPGADITTIYNISSSEECCNACTNNAQCVIGVFATDVNACIIKNGCLKPVFDSNRVLVNINRPFPPDSPWSCVAEASMLGGYSNLEQASDAMLDNHAEVITPLEAIVTAANASGNAFEVVWALGTTISTMDTSQIPAAVSAAAASDLVIMVLGDSAEATGYDASVSCGEGADRPSIDLPGVQLQLLAQVIRTETPVVVILVHGRPVGFGANFGGAAVSQFQINNTQPLNKQVGALLAAWRPGCEAGTALWDLLVGNVSPSGRLAQAWPVATGAVHNGGVSPWFQKWCSEECGGYTLKTPYAPAYAFGYGLDYLSVNLGATDAIVDSSAQTVNITVAVNNTAPMGGAKVIEVYFSQAVCRYTRYRLMLGGFEKVYMQPKSTTMVAISLPWSNFAYYDPVAQQDVVEAGDYTVSVCHDSMSCQAINQLTITIPVTTWYT